MVKKIKKSGSVFLAALFLAGCLNGCTGTQQTAATPAPAAAKTPEAVKAPEAVKQEDAKTEGAKPDEMKPITIRVFKAEHPDQPVSKGLLSFNTIAEKTGVTIKWEQVPSDARVERYNLIIAGGDIPDVMVYTTNDLLQVDGKSPFLALDELLKTNGKNILDTYNKDPQTIKDITANDGHMYIIPMLSAIKAAQVHYVREDYLKKFNLDVPKTTEDYYQMLKTFREEDANGNGIQDEIPFVTRSKSDGLKGIVEMFGINREWFLEDGEIKYGITDPRMKEAIAYLNKLYTEKLIDAEYLTTDQNLWQSKVTNNLGITLHDWSTRLDFFNKLFEEIDKSVTFIGFTPPAAPGVKSGTYFQMERLRSTSAAVSKNTPYAEQIMNMFNFIFSPEGKQIMNFGVEGQTYTMVNGKPVYTELITKNPQGMSIQNALYSFGVSVDFPFEQDKEYEYQLGSDTINKLRDEYEPLIRKAYPTLTFTPEEQQLLKSKYTEIKTYVDEMFDKFVMGTESMDKYDAFVEQVNKMGIEDVVNVQKEAYKRYNNK